jgi:hypothetical protein
MAILSDADKRFLILARRENKGFHLATEWYLRGWTPLAYQWGFHHWPVMNTSFVAGIATGKTSIVAASYLMDCIATPYFRALNTSVTAKQAELPFDMAMAWVEGNDRLEHLIENISLRPFPVITFKNFSQFEFRTAGTDARFIRGSEYDRINFDEAGLDHAGTIIKVLRGRLRGTRPDGSIRMARLDVTTSPTEALWLRERFKRGLPGEHTYDPNYRSLRVATWDNTKLTKAQVEAMKAEYPPDMIDVEMGGYFPDFGLSMFPYGHLAQCTDQSMYDAVWMAVDGEKARKGYRLDEDPRHGITLYERPVKPGRIYIVAGDPGTGNYPMRNAASVIVWDVTEKPYTVVYFHWISGRGSYNPFLQSFKYAIRKYSPVLKGLDATGTQKGIDELAFENAGIATDKLNFGSDKNAMLNSLVADVTNQHLRFPPIKGLIRQMSTYTHENDRKGHPQDIVMAMAMLAYLARYIPEEPMTDSAPASANFRNRSARTNTVRRARTR